MRGTMHSLIEDTRSNFDLSSVDFDDFVQEQPEDVKRVMNAIIKDPKILGPEGKINYSALTRPTGMSIHYVRKAVDKIKDVLKESHYGE